MDKHEVSEKFYAWVNQKPGLEWVNYGNSAALRSEYRKIAQQKTRACEALNVFNALPYDEICLRSAMRYFSGRLSFDKSGNLQYCTGQYWPTEYRLAAAVVLEGYVFELTRGNRSACFKVLYQYGFNVKRTMRRAWSLAKKFAELDVQDYSGAEKLYTRMEKEYKNPIVYTAFSNLVAQYKYIIRKLQ